MSSKVRVSTYIQSMRWPTSEQFEGAKQDDTHFLHPFIEKQDNVYLFLWDKFEEYLRKRNDRTC